MKHILLVSTFQEGAYGHIVAKVLTEMGYGVIPFDHRKLKYDGLNPKQVGDRYVSQLRIYDPDYVFAIKGRGIPPDVIRETGAKTVLWWLDNVTRFIDFEEYISVYDKYYAIEASQGHPWMAIGIDPEIHCPVQTNDEAFKSDITFVGTGHPKRTKRVEEILRHLPYKVKIWGNSWEGRLQEPSIWTGVPVYFQNLYKVYTSNNMILNVHYYPGITPNMRTIEAPASATAMISDTGEGIDACLKPGKEYIPYESVQEARYLIGKYMEDYEELDKIAFAGFERVMKDHLLKNKLKEMLK